MDEEFHIRIEDINPISVNHYLANRVMMIGGKPRVIRFLTKDAKIFQEQFKTVIRKKLGTHVPSFYLDRVEVFITVTFKDNIRRDVANHEKIISDCLEGLVFKDDKQIIKLHLEKDRKPTKSIEILVIPYKGDSEWGIPK